ncbi:hypothetical protein V5S96_09960 [Corynebacterium mastitidis]|uniref:HTH marR-type domain-containing protein n=1 Tax=Corynebacterium mastitidis TaxID=161890 RepID=A0ABU8P0Q7_9CORY
MTPTRALDRLALPWPLSLLFGAGMGLSCFLTTIDRPLWSMVPMILAAIPVIAAAQRSPLSSTSNWDHRDLYSSKTSWLYLIPLLLWIFVVPLAPETPTTGVIVGVLAFALCVLLGRYSHRLAGADGRRHARELLDKDVAISEQQIDLAREHRDVLSALYALGAVEGIRVRTRLAAHVLNTNATVTLRKAREPQSAGLLYTSAVDAGDDPDRMLIALTPEGVHALSRVTQAAPQPA